MDINNPTDFDDVLNELREMRRLGLFNDQLHERARAVVREQAADWQCLSTHEMADMALDLARVRR